MCRHLKVWLLASFAIVIVTTLAAERRAAAQARADIIVSAEMYGDNWRPSGLEFWRVTETAPLGRMAYYGTLFDGTMHEKSEQQVTVSASASAMQPYDFTLTRSACADHFRAAEPVILPGNLTVEPAVYVSETTFDGRPATVVERRVTYPSFGYYDQWMQNDGTWEVDESYFNWRPSHSEIRRVFCIEAVAGAPALVAQFTVTAEADPAALGENPEAPYFEAALAETEAFVARWRVMIWSMDPPAQTGVQGSVYLPGQSWMPDIPDRFPIAEAQVELLQGGAAVAETFSGPDGGFIFADVQEGNDYAVRVTLAHAVSNPSYFRLVYDQENDAITITTAAFSIDENTPDPFVLDINLRDAAALTMTPATLTAVQLVDAGHLWYYAREAWQMAFILLGEPLDLTGLTIRAFSTMPADPTAQAYWYGPMAHQPWADPLIELNLVNSSFGRTSHRGTIMHEFGHHIMTDAYGDLLPYIPGEPNHGNFANDTSTDSWVEGFATFYALWTQKEELQLQFPALFIYGSRAHSLEPNELAWGAWEEFAVAGLLWDIIDPVDENDCTLFPVTGHITQPTATITTSVLYCDRVQMPRDALWETLTSEATTFTAPPATAPAGYQYLYDVTQLYEALATGYALSYIAGETPLSSTGLDPIDELFIAHGFFGDINPQNLMYDVGEPIGYTPNRAISLHDGTAYAERIPRRSPPLWPQQYIAYDAVDAADGAAVPLDLFRVDVRFDPPFSGYDYYYVTAAETSGQLPYSGPPAHYAATTTIAPAEAHLSAAPLTFTNAAYWQQRNATAEGALWQYTFSVTVDESRAPAAGATAGSAGSAPVGLDDDFAVYDPDTGFAWGGVLGWIGGGVLLVVLMTLWRGRRKRPEKPAQSPPRKKKQQPAAPTPAAATPAPVHAAPQHPASPPPAAVLLTCPHCGHAHGAQAKFCGNCGQSLVQPVCPHCGATLSAGARFCHRCGKPAW